VSFVRVEVELGYLWAHIPACFTVGCY
jgi:hypothetical protein